MTNTDLADGVVAVVKADCPTCQLVTPVLSQLLDAGVALTIYSQDDPGFPAGLPVVDDSALAVSSALDLRAVPTLLRIESGGEVARQEGWDRERWESLTGISGLGDGLPAYQPG